MRIGAQERGKLIALLALAAVCVPLLYRNVLLPEEPLVPAALPADSATLADTEPGPGPRQALSSPRSASRPASRNVRALRDNTMSQQQLAALDPTLRVEQLERSRQVSYSGESRNIFQFYTPPPSEPAPAPVVPTPAPRSPSSRAPQPLTIPLKFYGIASRPGNLQKKAFLTDGEEIFIGEEGDLIAKRYKIIRIGVNSIEVEDSRDQRREQLPLIEE